MAGRGVAQGLRGIVVIAVMAGIAGAIRIGRARKVEFVEGGLLRRAAIGIRHTIAG